MIDESKVFVNLTRDEVKRSPLYSEKVLPTREYETRLHGHYNARDIGLRRRPSNNGGFP